MAACGCRTRCGRGWASASAPDRASRMLAADALALPGVSLPEGHRLVSLATRPDLGDPMSDFNVAVWPEFLLNDPVMNEHWHHTGDHGRTASCCCSMPRTPSRPPRTPRRSRGTAPTTGCRPAWTARCWPRSLGSRERDARRHHGRAPDHRGPRPTRHGPRRPDAPGDVRRRAIARPPGGHRMCPADLEGALPAGAHRAVCPLDP